MTLDLQVGDTVVAAVQYRHFILIITRRGEIFRLEHDDYKRIMVSRQL